MMTARRGGGQGRNNSEYLEGFGKIWTQTLQEFGSIIQFLTQRVGGGTPRDSEGEGEGMKIQVKKRFRFREFKILSCTKTIQTCSSKCRGGGGGAATLGELLRLIAGVILKKMTPQ